MKNKRNNDTLIRQFIIIFVVFIGATIILSGIFTYLNQSRLYNARCQNILESITHNLSERIIAEGKEVDVLKDYFIKHKSDLRIAYDFNGDISKEKKEFENRMESKYPGKTLFSNISFEQLDKETQNAWALYTYEKWLNIFETEKTCFGVKYTYFIFPISDTEMCYLIDGVREEFKENGNSYISLGYEGLLDYSTHKNMWETCNNKTVTGEVDIMKNEYGNVFTYYYPVVYEGKLLGLVAAEMDIDIANANINKSVLIQSILYIIVLGLSSLLALAFISKSILRRITKLDMQIQKYSETKDPQIGEIVYKYAQNSNDEISTLSRNFSNLTRELEEYMENLQIITAERERLGAELSVATNIQASMLPHDFPKCKEYSLFASMDPAKEVGGDFYDFFAVDENNIAIVIADVSGKGVPAALFMVVAKTLIENGTKNNESVEDIFNNVNNQLIEGNGEGLFVTAWLGILNIRTGELNYIEAGHDNPFIISRNGEIKEIVPKKKKMPLASWEGLKYIPNEMKLQRGDKIFLYTDGVPEATNSFNELYGMERLKKILSDSVELSPEELLCAVRIDVDRFVDGASQFDDLTMLALEWTN